MSNTAKVKKAKATSNAKVEVKPKENSTNCSKCNRKLRVPESKELGICRSCRKSDSKPATKLKSKLIPKKTEEVAIPEVKLDDKKLEEKINAYLKADVGPGKYFSSVETLIKKLEATKHKTWATIPVDVFTSALKGVSA